jgi:hypothetical protein
MIVALTTDQRIELENNARFQNLVRMAILNQAIYWRGLDGTTVPGNDRVRWAKSRLLATGIVLNPTSQDYNAWVRQFIILTKDMAVYDDTNAFNVDTVLDYMIANSKFDELADLAFNLRILKVEF